MGYVAAGRLGCCATSGMGVVDEHFKYNPSTTVFLWTHVKPGIGMFSSECEWKG